MILTFSLVIVNALKSNVRLLDVLMLSALTIKGTAVINQRERLHGYDSL